MPWIKKTPTSTPVQPGLASILPKLPRLEKSRPAALQPKPKTIPAVAADSTRRKVLIVEDDASIRNVLYVLLAGLGFDGDVAHSGRQALELASRESFDAVLLDLRSCDMATEQVVSGIKQVQPSLVGRVLVITGEVADRQTLETIERYTLLHMPRHRVMQDIGSRLKTVLGVPHEQSFRTSNLLPGPGVAPPSGKGGATEQSSRRRARRTLLLPAIAPLQPRQHFPQVADAAYEHHERDDGEG
jgi:CheY-like chemotaxis protein